ncbi:type VII secretion protein EccE [Glycomyces buryatensis]|uniref:Type VII secretion protein EccE n=1 Tax=Glycomyces buryatensis TaxID=2570927 RepID=A0A4S8QM03_9ACTN|nr:type VII secretion protein EccE [Glycomyces buryatensis]THV42429.1 type VII secretion protein EccE [Glycomyces buryatensis]
MTMLQGQQQARGTASVQSQDTGPAPGESVVFTTRSSGRLGPLTVAQLIAVQIGLVIALAALGFGMIPGAAGGGVALVIMIIAFWRKGDYWWYQTWPLKSRLRRRVRALDPEQLTEVLHRIAPDLGITGVEDRDENVGIGHDNGGWFSVIEIGSTDGVTKAIPLERLERLFDETSVPVTAVQLVGHTTPVGLAAYDNSAAARSYRELLGDSPAVVHHKAWLAVRLGARDAREATTDRGGEVDGVYKALASTAQRISKLLGNVGVPNRILDAESVREAVSQSLGVAFAPVPGERTAEDWTHWYADGLRHVSFRITKWPTDANNLYRTVDALSGVPAAFVTVSTLVTAGTSGKVNPDGRVTGRQLAVDSVVRLALDQTAWESAQNQLLNVADQLGVRLQRLDGEHGPAAYASAPTGGGPQ